MNQTRRQFLAASATALAAAPNRRPLGTPGPGDNVAGPLEFASLGQRNDPWIEIDASAIQHNAGEIARLSGGRPILAVVKNNGYGLGLAKVGPILDGLDEIAGLAVVKSDQAVALRESGVRKPVLLMGLFPEQDVDQLVEQGIELAPYTDGLGTMTARLAGRMGRPIPVQIYLDTGMGRLGVPFRRAPEWIAELASHDAVEIRGMFSALTEEDDFDPEQIRRFESVARTVRAGGLDLGRLHVVSSHGLFFRPTAFMDMVRPGLVLYGAYPAGAKDTGAMDLRVAFRLRARVVRVERLEPGDGVSYGRNYVADRPTWTATIPLGHADGYSRNAVNGCEVLIGAQTYPVIGAVSASHTIVELGSEKTVEVGDVATLVGPDAASIHPNAVAERCGISVYDVLMHMGGGLPRLLGSA